MAEDISVLLADDHPMFRKGLRTSIEESEGISLIGEAEDGQQALDMLKRLQPKVAVLDVNMPKLDGFEVARTVQSLLIPTKLVFLTLHTEEEMFHTAIEVGAKGYVLKDSASREIINSVRAAAAGHMYVSPSMTPYLVAAMNGSATTSPSSGLEILTMAERRILRLIASGKSSKEIGEILRIHYRTVENHRTSMCRKLGLEGSNALLRFSLQIK